MLEIFLRPQAELVRLGKIGQRLGKTFRARFNAGRQLGKLAVPLSACLGLIPLDAASDLNRRAGIPFERILEIVCLGPWLDDPTTSAKELE